MCLREFYWNKWKRELEGYNLTITTELELLELSIERNWTDICWTTNEQEHC